MKCCIWEVVKGNMQAFIAARQGKVCNDKQLYRDLKIKHRLGDWFATVDIEETENVFFSSKGSIAPASASIDAHSHLIK
jgi:hypothetical protein